MHRVAFVSLCLLASVASAQTPEAKKPARPGFRLVDQRWVRPQRALALGDLVELTEEQGRHRLVSRPARDVEPVLGNWRTSVVLLERSEYAWKLSAVGRRWNDDRSGASQHLQLVAASDDMPVDETFRLTKLTVEPGVSTLQTAVVESGEPLNVIVMLTDDFCELAVGPLGQPQTTVALRAPTARDMLRDHPVEAKRYLVPALKLLSDGENPLHPAAGDVYRAFPDVPPDDMTLGVVRALVADLASVDPLTRRRGERELRSLGRKGVRAAMAVDPETIPLDAADRLAAFVAAATVDPRTPEQLRASAAFLSDCLQDPDPLVRKAAGDAVSRLK
jgi:hypothetical protein